MSSNNLPTVTTQAEEKDGPETLQRSLGASQLVLLGVAAIIGAGIFVATGVVAANNTGPAIVFSFVIAALACLCAGLCYAEFAALIPVSGSAHSYVSASFGRIAGWLIGWCLILEYLMAAATAAVGWSAYACGLFGSLGYALPAVVAGPAFELSATKGLTRTTALLNVPAVLVLLGVTAALVRGLQQSVRTNVALVAIKLTVIALFIGCGIAFVDPNHWRPFLPPNTGEFGNFGWSGMLRGAGVIFFAYLSFDTVSTAARETHDPQRNMPRGIIGSLLICTVIYIAFSPVLTGLAPYTALVVPNPVSVALDYAGPRLQFLKLAVEISAVIGLTSVVLALLYGQSRIVYAMAQDGFVPGALGRISLRTHAPLVAVLICGGMATLAAAFFPAQLLSELISIGTLTAFVFVCAGVLVLRIQRPDLPRPFRTPFAPLVCTAGILTCGYLMAALPSATWLRFLAWLALGLSIYCAYGRRRSHGAALTQLLPRRE